MIGDANPLGTMNRTMQEAMQLVRQGNLQAATQAIQRGLHVRHDNDVTSAERHSAAPAGTFPIDGEYRIVCDDAANAEVVDVTEGDAGWTDAREDGAFREHCFECAAGAIAYKLFVPTGLEGVAAPLLLLLHGCTQAPDDFARGTRMNVVAQAQGYVIAYPAQSRKRNASGCWNWFRPGDQQRGEGEAALLAELTQYLVSAHRLDAQRVYVAGLSAGGAMATVLGGAYPDVYAAIGVHSGLPSRAAHDLPSALAAMRQGTGRAAATRGAPIPAIVFHGDQDTTVDPCNAAAVIEQARGTQAWTADTLGESASTTVEHGSVAGGRNFTRTTYRDARGRVMAELWTVHGAGHAWSGGDKAGSYTDPSGPDASEQMLRFFSECSRATMRDSQA